MFGLRGLNISETGALDQVKLTAIFRALTDNFNPLANFALPKYRYYLSFIAQYIIT